MKVALSSGPLGELDLAGKDPPTEFCVLRAGWNQSTKGKFLFDETAAKSVMAAYAARGLDKVQIDFEHQSMQPPPAGGDARKLPAGWWKPEVRNGELWATGVSWTEEALDALQPQRGAPKYRYFSPVLAFDEETRRVTAAKNLALTNDPALNDLQPLAAASAVEDPKEIPMATECASCATLTAQLSTANAKIKDIETQCSTLTARMSAMEGEKKESTAAMTALSASHSELGSKLVALTGQQTVAGAIGTVESWKSASGQVAQLLADKKVAETAALTTQMGTILEAAVAAGKLPPALKPFEEQAAKAFGGGEVTKAGVDYLSAKWGSAPKIVTDRGAAANATGLAMLTSDDYAAGKALGHGPEDTAYWDEVVKFKTAELERRARIAAAGVAA